MFELTQCGKERGDCTAPYSVNLKKEYTVSEFVKDVVSNRGDEWGYFIIDDGETIFGSPRFEYRWGELLSTFPEEILNKRIKSVKADGGWGSMDYIIEIIEQEETADKKLTPQQRYEAKHAVKMTLRFLDTTDADIIARLAAQPKETGGKQGYIKRLIRADIENEKDAGNGGGKK